ncbi:preprotein translocase subunit SecE [bacterium]|nr:preprotein translocase subunit SecE [bacterium]MDE6224128.1 preprotein translocase subunit SecE [Alphaproteobacteria bacterium]
MFGKIVNFFEQVKQEMAKVVWPTKRETVSSAVMIFVFSILFALFFFLVDRFFMWLMSFVFNF